jgi:hypothetical protein
MDLFKQSTKYREFLLFKKLKEMEDTEDDVSVLHSKLPAKKITHLSRTSEGIISASKLKWGKLYSAKKLEGNMMAKLFILEKSEVKDSKSVSIAKKKSLAIIMTVETVPVDDLITVFKNGLFFFSNKHGRPFFI